MSWYSDGERFDEFDPEWCERSGCPGGNSKEECDRCIARHESEREEDEK